MQQAATERRKRLHRNFIAALDLLDTLEREPDRWEEECLSYALSALACGLFLVAEVELDAFGRPIAKRPRDEVALLETQPQRFTKQMLRHGLQFIQQRDEDGDLAMLPAFAVTMPADLRATLR
jgi:hypothetical protein